MSAQNSGIATSDEPIPPSNQGQAQQNYPGPDSAIDSVLMDNQLSPPPTFYNQAKLSQFAPSFQGPPLYSAKSPATVPSSDTAISSAANYSPPAGGASPLSSAATGNFTNNAAPSNLNLAPADIPPVPVGENSGDTFRQTNNLNPQTNTPQALMHPPTGSDPVAANLRELDQNSLPTALAAPAKLDLPAPKEDVELTVAMAEGVLNSAPESAAMGGGFNYSDLALAFPEETSEARKTKISQGDKSYDLNLPDTQERYQAEIPLTWVLWAVTEGDIHQAIQNGNVVPEEWSKLKFGEVEQPLKGTQEGRLVRVFSCGPLTAPNWNEAWMAMWSNVFGFTPPPPTLADLCSQPMYRDYRIAGDKVRVDLPVAGRGALMFVTFNPVDWLKPEFQSTVGAKHIEGEPIPLAPENFKATLEKGELIRAVGL